MSIVDALKMEVVSNVSPAREFPHGATPAATLVLVGAGFLHNVDRTVITGLVQPLKTAFSLSDAAVGALSGVAFAVAYATLGVPFARLADLANRKWILIGALGLWSAFTVACGFTAGFFSFFIARLGVAIAEAAGTPALHALFSDSYPPTRRGRAASLIVMAMTFGSIVGVMSGGVLAEHFGWRMAFWVCGAPGLVLAFIGLFVLRETRSAPVQISPAVMFDGAMRSAWRELLAKRSFRWLILGTVGFGFWVFGTATWFPTYLMRSHGLSLSQAALSFALVSGAAVVLGNILTAVLSDGFTKRDSRSLCWLPAAAALACAVFSIPMYFMATATGALVLYALANICYGIVGSMQFAASYALTGSRSRALGVATLNFFNFLIALGLAPLATGALSDFLEPTRAQESLSGAMLTMTLALPISALCYFLGGLNFARDMQRD